MGYREKESVLLYIAFADFVSSIEGNVYHRVVVGARPEGLNHVNSNSESDRPFLD